MSHSSSSALAMASSASGRSATIPSPGPCRSAGRTPRKGRRSRAPRGRQPRSCVTATGTGAPVRPRDSRARCTCREWLDPGRPGSLAGPARARLKKLAVPESRIPISLAGSVHLFELHPAVPFRASEAHQAMLSRERVQTRRYVPAADKRTTPRASLRRGASTPEKPPSRMTLVSRSCRRSCAQSLRKSAEPARDLPKRGCIASRRTS